MLELLHYTHVLAGALFVGGVMFWEWVLGAMFAAMSPEDRQKFSIYARRFTGGFMVWTMVIAVLAGIARLLASGAIRSFSDLFQGYGLRATLAVVVIVTGEIIMTPIRKKMRQGIDELNNDLFLNAYHRHRIVSTTVVAIIIFLMVSMRMGLY